MPITGAARLAGIMGWPIAHSRSPALHGYWLAENGIDGAYVPLPVHPDRLEQALRALPALGFRGCRRAPELRACRRSSRTVRIRIEPDDPPARGSPRRPIAEPHHTERGADGGGRPPL